MLKYVFSFSLLIGSLASSFAQLQVQLAYARFFSPSTGPYIEVYLFYNANNVTYMPVENGFQGKLNVNYRYSTPAFSSKQLRDSSLGNDELPGKKQSFSVLTPINADSNLLPQNFLSQHRIQLDLDTGKYTMNVEIVDAHSKRTTQVDFQFDMHYNTSDLMLSDIEIYERATKSTGEGMFSKNGYQIIPYTSEIFPISMKEFGFYTELYNMDQKVGEGTDFLIVYFLEDLETGKMLSEFRGFTRKKASDVNVIMGKFLVENLSGGNYKLQVQVLTKENELLADNSILFHKENPAIDNTGSVDIAGTFVENYQDVDSLAEHIAYLQPIADRLEWEFAENQLRGRDLELMKKYFLNFWRNRNQLEPDIEWYKYYKQVQITINNFDTPMRPGYLSDRGFRYLKYGPPDDRYESFDEALAYPHEVWYYNKVNNQTNRVIIYYNKSQVLNDFEILHSDILGEIYNKDWNLILHRMNPGFYDAENPTFQDYFGDQTRNLMTR